MKRLENVQALIGERASWSDSQTIGFVPTMGALHAGHRALLERARRESDVVVLSIFVNPTQFNNADDFNKYPQTLEADLLMAKDCGADAVFLPNREQMYPDGYRFQLSENEFSRVLCGAHRPGHFEGVLTVVMKLFQLVRPKRAYFGEKDFQQLLLIRQMADAFFLGIEIVPCPTIRESDGLAMSSRNVRLSPKGRALAPKLHEILNRNPEEISLVERKAELTGLGFEVEYLEEHFGRRFVAAWLDGVRLIDNVAI